LHLSLLLDLVSVVLFKGVVAIQQLSDTMQLTGLSELMCIGADV